MKKFDKEPIAWITRNGKHVPIFDDDYTDEVVVESGDVGWTGVIKTKANQNFKWEKEDGIYKLYQRYPSKPNTMYPKGDYDSYNDMITAIRKRKYN